jgi:DNA-binding MarR family transcriptional regulator
MITRMAENDWLRKERSKTDERKVHIYLQPKALQEQQDITQKVTEEILSCHIELQEYEQLMQQLNQLQQKLKNRKEN